MQYCISDEDRKQHCSISTDISFKDKNLCVPFYPDYGDHNYFQITAKNNI